MIEKSHRPGGRYRIDVGRVSGFRDKRRRQLKMAFWAAACNMRQAFSFFSFSANSESIPRNLSL